MERWEIREEVAFMYGFMEKINGLIESRRRRNK